MKVVTRELHKGKPVASLIEKKSKKAGRNNNGHVTTRHQGGGHKQHYRVIDFVRNVHDQGSLVAAVCHAGLVLASAGIARDRDLTCVALVKDDVVHAGGRYHDKAVVRDGNLISSRLPSDLHLFCKEIVAYLRDAPAPAQAEQASR